MKFSCKTSELLNALQLVSRAIGTQQALPILGNILLEAEGKRCRVSATDLELSIVTHLDAAIENEGAITIPAKAILNFAQYNNDHDVLLETVEGTQLKCTSSHTKTMIAGEAATEYPNIPPVEKNTSLTLDARDLLQGLHLVTFTCARTSLRPVLSGVYLRTERGTLILVGTDSYRLSEYKIPLKDVNEEISCIVPVKVLDELKVMLAARRPTKDEGKEKDKEKEKETEDVKGKITLILSAQQIEVQTGQTRLISRLIEGKFPDYQQIIPKDAGTVSTLPTGELTTTVRRMHYFAKEVNNNLTFHFAGGNVHIATPTTQAGRDEADLPTKIEGGENKIALSSSYLLDFLTHLPSGEIEVCLVDSMHPALFRLPNDEQFLHLVMPLRMPTE
jgi:DNA polymerase-3 subunit beta